MKNLREKQKGTILGFIAVLGVALGLLVLYISHAVRLNAGQMVYFNNMNRVYRLTESGLAVALGELSVNPSTGVLTNSVVLDGPYQNYVERITAPIYNGFYILTSATITVNGKSYTSQLHTYAGVSNIGSYFAALKNEFILSPGMDATGGRIYAPNLVFLTTGTTTPPTISRAQTAEYVYAATARTATGFDFNDPLVWENSPSPGTPPYFLRNGAAPTNEYQICLGDNQEGSLDPCKDSLGNLVRPIKLDYPIQFPELSNLPGGDFDRYRDLATAGGANHLNSGIWDMRSWDHIYPPGYSGTPYGNDYYNNNTPNHRTNNADHVYFAEQGIQIGRTLTSGTSVHGQVLFVTPGDIEIWGDIFSYGSTSPTELPGFGQPSSSTAHQCVLIAGGKIIIKATDTATNLTAPGATRVVQAFFFAPNGGLNVQAYLNPANIPSGRNFIFQGAWILGQTDPPPNNLPTQFTGIRRYSYMTSLKDNPPPYMPALAEIYQSFEVSKFSESLY